MFAQTVFPIKTFATDIASEPRVWIMNGFYVPLKITFLFTGLWTNVTLEGLDVTNTMNRRQVIF